MRLMKGIGQLSSYRYICGPAYSRGAFEDVGFRQRAARRRVSQSAVRYTHPPQNGCTCVLKLELSFVF
jgi:hypothetical protein